MFLIRLGSGVCVWAKKSEKNVPKKEGGKERKGDLL